MTNAGYEVLIIDAVPRSVAAVRADVPRGKVGEHFGRHLDKVYAAARAGTVKLDGQNIFIYRGAAGGLLQVDFGVGTAGPFSPAGEVAWRETPQGQAVTTVHFGDYGGLRHAHDAVQQWCKANGRSLAGPSWEIYGHWHEGPEPVRTDIFYLLSDATKR